MHYYYLGILRCFELYTSIGIRASLFPTTTPILSSTPCSEMVRLSHVLLPVLKHPIRVVLSFNRLYAETGCAPLCFGCKLVVLST